MITTRREFLKSCTTSAAAVSIGMALPPFIEASPLQSSSDAKPLAKKVFLKRLDSAREKMKQEKFNCSIVTPGNNLYYLTGVRTWRSERLIALILPSDKDAIVVCPAFEEERIRSLSVIDDIRTWEEYENPYSLVENALREIGAIKGVIGVGPRMWYNTYDNLTKVAPDAKFRNGEIIVGNMRLIKSTHEINFLREAVAITERRIKNGFETITAGITEREFSRQIGGGLVQFGPTAAIPHAPAGDRKLMKDDVILVDTGDRVHGYTSDISRTVVFGKASNKIEKVWNIVRRAQTAGINAAKPGVTAESVDMAARRVIEDSGYGKYFTHRLGHGIGLDGHEEPYLVRGSNLVLKPGMACTIEPGIYLPGEFGVRLEDDVVITENGCEVMSHRPERLETI